ncbi:hypothetical protein [Rhizobium changzhiense]|uniref:hypothetical protein n=1 Tax=Rhizobium changzhiense TaxID=2692317 RepID=UPI001FEFAE21|nr:hypothetical protein [Rhizobium changzhiense]
MRLLIVEDEPGIALVIEDVAIDAGFEIIGIAGNMSEALELAPKQTSPSSTSVLGMDSPGRPFPAPSFPGSDLVWCISP